jgi:tetratricopeptide (TPR) repeat protein
MFDSDSEHNRLFQEACSIIRDEIPLHDNPDLPLPDEKLDGSLKRALEIFNQVLAINPENWNAMWLIGKIYQRFQDKKSALSWFEKAYQINPSQTDIVREASMCAMDLGNHDAAITFAHRGVQIEPTNSGLQANLAIAYLLSNRIDDAKMSIDRAIAGDPEDSISQTIQDIIEHFSNSGRVPPSTMPTLLKYWNENRYS